MHAAERGRQPELIAERRSRMADSPFAFLRGTADVMAHDLVGVPVSGVTHQVCGDAHAANFGLYASPEREIVFDLNDFDESRPGPWEWDIARLAASVAVVARANKHRAREQRASAQLAVRAFRERLRHLAGEGLISPWIHLVRADAVIEALPTAADRRLARKLVASAKRRTSTRALGRFVETVDGVAQIRDKPPLIGPIEGAEAERIRSAVERYRQTLRERVASVLGDYHAGAVGHKVVGVGSVGLRDYLVLLEGLTEDDLLVLQVKEAAASALDPYLPDAPGGHQGRRVVEGQHVMQAVSDPLLGWTKVSERDYYVRRYGDVKGAVDLEHISPAVLRLYAALCGSTLALAHARAGQPALLSAYLGGSDRFDRAISAFAVAYARQTERDHAVFKATVEP